ncbi:SDR family oxidoreductase [Streptomyces sp. NPDC002787]
MTVVDRPRGRSWRFELRQPEAGPSARRGAPIQHEKIPMRHTGRPEDIAEAAAFLAGYITGIVLDVDGGISIGSSIR